MGDDFFDRAPDEPQQAADGSPRVHHHRAKDQRLLRRDEVFVPEVYGGVLGEWKRDQAYMQYLILKGVPAKLPRPLLVITAVIVGVCILVAAWMAAASTT